jgi:hypothetical protein
MTDVAESPNYVLFLFSVEVELVAACGAVVKEMKLFTLLKWLLRHRTPKRACQR